MPTARLQSRPAPVSPSTDTCCWKVFESAFRAWVGSVVGAIRQVAIDGKSLRGSADGELGPLHMVSAIATEYGLTLGQEAVASKSNEITAIPTLLLALDIEGALVSIDAMGTQREIANVIRDQSADYLLAVKNNQPGLRAALEDAFNDVPVEGFEQILRGHGRIVLQHAQAVPNNGQVDTGLWRDCASTGRSPSISSAWIRPRPRAACGCAAKWLDGMTTSACASWG